MPKLIPGIVLLFVLIVCQARGEAGYNYGPRPVNSIYDPERSLSPELTNRLAGHLGRVRERDQADVMVVLLPSLGDLPPEHEARRFDEAWGTGLLHAVVLDVAGRNDGPWVYVGGVVTESDRRNIIPKMTRDALRLARQEPDREACLRSATEQTSSIVRYLMGKVKNQAEMEYTARMQVRMEYEEMAERRRILIGAAAFSAVPAAGLLFLACSYYHRLRPRRFPPVSWSRRLGAPYSGGGNASIDLGS